jgi:putative aminopeptidase FrvX
MLNRRVRIKMKSGKTHIGKVVKVTSTHIYLQKNRRKKGKPGTRFFFAPFILPLVLFDLLAIALIV